MKPRAISQTVRELFTLLSREFCGQERGIALWSKWPWDNQVTLSKGLENKNGLYDTLLAGTALYDDATSRGGNPINGIHIITTPYLKPNEGHLFAKHNLQLQCLAKSLIELESYYDLVSDQVAFYFDIYYAFTRTVDGRHPDHFARIMA